MLFFFKVSGHHRYLHLLTHSFPTRRSSDLFAAPDVEGVLRGLDAAAADASPPSGTRAESPRRPPMLAFLFSGQGAQFPGMARELVDRFPVVRETLAEAADLA